MAVFFFSDINRRSSNEDSYCDIEFRVNHEAAIHAMTVADGMGGLAGGKQYSSEAVRLFNERLLRLIMGEEFKDNSLERQMELLTEFCGLIFQQINQELYMKGLNAGMKGGTTLTAAIHFWDRWIIANCGDSPAYSIKGGKLHLVSDIQNAAWHMVQQGETRVGSVVYYQNKNRLLQYLGRREPVTPHLVSFHEEEADALLLGTDGAFGTLTGAQMEQIIQSPSKPQELPKKIMDAAKAGGEEDNQTALLYIARHARQEGNDPETPVYERNGIDKVLESDPPVHNKETADPGESAVLGDYRKVEEKRRSLFQWLHEYRS